MGNRHLLMTHEGSSDGLQMAVTAHPVVNLALIHNNVPIIQQIVVTNTGDAALTDVRIAAQISGLLDDDAPEWSTVIPTIGVGESVGRELIREVVPSRAHVKSLGEAYDAELVATASAEGADVSVTAPLRLLAANEWFAAPFCFESLASFVEPNTPAVTSILSDASDILAAKTGSSSLEGYQSGPNRAGLIAAALYAALVRRDIRYIDPPASFEFTGQEDSQPTGSDRHPVRHLPRPVRRVRSCLEAAGLHPLVWVIDGHAFVGFLREDNTLSTPLVLEPNVMVNLAESGRAVILEAAFYGDASAPSFRDASGIANRYLQDLSRMLFVLDVSAARRAGGVKPFPSAATETEMPRRPAVIPVAPEIPLQLHWTT